MKGVLFTSPRIALPISPQSNTISVFLLLFIFIFYFYCKHLRMLYAVLLKSEFLITFCVLGSFKTTSSKLTLYYYYYYYYCCCC